MEARKTFPLLAGILFLLSGCGSSTSSLLPPHQTLPSASRVVTQARKAMRRQSFRSQAVVTLRRLPLGKKTAPVSLIRGTMVEDPRAQRRILTETEVAAPLGWTQEEIIADGIFAWGGSGGRVPTPWLCVKGPSGPHAWDRMSPDNAFTPELFTTPYRVLSRKVVGSGRMDGKDVWIVRSFETFPYAHLDAVVTDWISKTDWRVVKEEAVKHLIRDVRQYEQSETRTFSDFGIRFRASPPKACRRRGATIAIKP